jgi:TolB protein
VGAASQIWVANADGSDRHQITSGEAFNATPAWSPDGQQIALVNEIGGISVMNPDGTGMQSLISAPGNWAPTWSPDSKQIAFGSSEGIGIVNRDGTGLHFVAQTPYGSEPAWSPDGRRIAFMRARSRRLKMPRFDLYVIRPDGTGLRRITTSPLEDTEPTWSPDGRRIAFTRFMRPHGRYCIRIFVVRPNGTGLRKLRGDCPLPNDQPEWSPDGRKIAFVQGNHGIVLINADGKKRRLFRPPLYGVTPSWEPLP